MGEVELEREKKKNRTHLKQTCPYLIQKGAYSKQRKLQAWLTHTSYSRIVMKIYIFCPRYMWKPRLRFV